MEGDGDQVAFVVEELDADSRKVLGQNLGFDVSDAAGEAADAGFDAGDALRHFQENFHGVADNEGERGGEENATGGNVDGPGALQGIGNGGQAMKGHAGVESEARVDATFNGGHECTSCL
jgi:hypothetical protein